MRGRDGNGNGNGNGKGTEREDSRVSGSVGEMNEEHSDVSWRKSTNS